MYKAMNDYILYNFDGIVYQSSDILKILTQCKEKITEHRCDLKWLYNYFDLQSDQCVYKIDDVVDKIAEQIALIFQIDEKFCIESEIKNCRRKFYYWEIDEPLLYFVNENLDNSKKIKRYKIKQRKLKKEDYDNLLTAACYLTILQPSNSAEQIDMDKKLLHKDDYNYVNAIKYIQNFVIVDIDIMHKPDLTQLCICLEECIRCFGAEYFYAQLIKRFAAKYNYKEDRIHMSDSIDIVFPTLYHYAVKVLTEKSVILNQTKFRGIIECREVTFEGIMYLAKSIVILLEKNNKMGISFIVKNVDDDYLRDLVEYSAVNDLHQCNFDGVLFLVERIIKAYGNDLKKKTGLPHNRIIDTIKRIVTRAQKDFKCGLVTRIGMEDLRNDELVVFEKLSESNPINEGYILPTEWNKVTDDSAWIIKKDKTFYVLPPVLSAWGIYDSINALLGWPSDSGHVFEKAVHEVFLQLTKKVYYGKYILKEAQSFLEFDKKTKKSNNGRVPKTILYESDGLVLDSDYALVIECKKKPLTREARGGKQEEIIKDLVESYIKGQSQACRLERAIRSVQVTENGNLAFFTADSVNLESIEHGESEDCKIVAECADVKTILRLTCTAGNYWVLSEIGIIGKIDDHFKSASFLNNSKNRVLKEYNNELTALHEVIGRIKTKDNISMNKKRINRINSMNHLFISFDKLYEVTKKLNGLPIGKVLWNFTRIQDRNNSTMNNISFLIDCFK